jgi:hypothetical protein
VNLEHIPYLSSRTISKECDEKRRTNSSRTRRNRWRNGMRNGIDSAKRNPYDPPKDRRKIKVLQKIIFHGSMEGLSRQ